MATHASALKAHRQSVARREHNRELRARLRTGLKDIRNAIASNDADGARKQLRAAFALIDKMASKGIIHRNAAARYKSRLHAGLARLAS